MSDYVSFRSFNLILSELNCTMRYPILGFAACEVWWAVWVATGLILYIWNPSRLLNGSFMSLPTITANYWKNKYTNCRFLWNFPQQSWTVLGHTIKTSSRHPGASSFLAFIFFLLSSPQGLRGMTGETPRTRLFQANVIIESCCKTEYLFSLFSAAINLQTDLLTTQSIKCGVSS